MAKKTIRLAAAKVPSKRSCSCANALEGAITTDLKAISAEKKKELGLIIEKYVK